MAPDPKNIIPKYYHIKQLLLDNINRGTYPPGKKFPPITELMKKFNISTTTARRVVAELVQEGVIYTVPSKGCFVTSEAVKGKKPAQPEVLENKKNGRVINWLTPGKILWRFATASFSKRDLFADFGY